MGDPGWAAGGEGRRARSSSRRIWQDIPVPGEEALLSGLLFQNSGSLTPHLLNSPSVALPFLLVVALLCGPRHFLFPSETISMTCMGDPLTQGSGCWRRAFEELG